jgi:hypothetical protein
MKLVVGKYFASLDLFQEIVEEILSDFKKTRP